MLKVIRILLVCVNVVLLSLPSTALGQTTTPQPISIVAVGDLVFTEAVSLGVERHGLDPLEAVKAELGRADLAFGNLECALASPSITGGASRPGQPRLRGTPKGAKVLADAGFDVVSIANNHAMDLGDAGLTSTRFLLGQHRIGAVGAGRGRTEAEAVFIRNVRGVKVGVAAFTFSKHRAPGSAMTVASLGNDTTALVRGMKRQVDVLLVSLHWGQEFSVHPAQHQIRLAHELIDAGADAILGHHPHVLQGIEVYRGRPVFYSLGNFLFGPQVGARGESILVELEVSKDKQLSRCRLLPIALQGRWGAPAPASGRQAASIMTRIQRVSHRWGTQLRAEPGGWASISVGP